MSNTHAPHRPVIELPVQTRHSRRTITDCKWKLRTFVARDAYAEYDFAAGYAREPQDRIRRYHVLAINSVMRARSSRDAWAQLLDRPLPELKNIPAEFDLIDSPDSEFRLACAALERLTQPMTSIPRLTEMAVSKVLYLLRPRFIAIADGYVRDCLGLSRRAPSETMLAVQRAVRALGRRNQSVLEELYEYANSLPSVVPEVGSCVGRRIPVRLSRARILDIVLWSDVAIHGATPHANWSRWYAEEVLGKKPRTSDRAVGKEVVSRSIQRPGRRYKPILPEGVRLFAKESSDDAYQNWLAAHPQGYVISCDPVPRKGSGMKLHRATCVWISDRSKGPFTTRAYGKAGAAHRSLLREWAVDVVGAELTECSFCKP